MLKDALGTAAKILATLRRFFIPLILTSLFYRVIAITILTPLVSAYAGLFFAGSGRLVIANEEIAEFFLQPIGFFALLVIAACSLTLAALEQACLMALLTQKDAAGAVSRVIQAFRFASKQILGIHKIALRIVLRVIATSAPFLIVAVVVYIALLREHDINYYLTSKPAEFKLALIVGMLLTAGLGITLIRYAVRVVFSLPILMFEARKPSEALRESALQSEPRRLLIAMGIGAWGLTVFAVSGLSAAAFIWASQMSLPFLLGNNTFLVPVFGLLFLSLTICQVLISIVATASFSTLVMILYDPLTPTVKRVNGRQAGGRANRYKTKLPLSGRVVVVGVVVSFFAATLSGWWLLSRTDLEDLTEVVAHRGASGTAPENTLSAVKQAIADSANWVEIDVQRTADGQVVVIHDRDLVGSEIIHWLFPGRLMRNLRISMWAVGSIHDFQTSASPPLRLCSCNAREKSRLTLN